MVKKNSKHDRDTGCNCPNCRKKRAGGGKGRAKDCLRLHSGLDPGGSNDQGAPSAGKAPPAMGTGFAATAAGVTAGGGQGPTTAGHRGATFRHAPLVGRGYLAAVTAGGGRDLARMLETGATFSPSPGPGAPTPPPPPPPGDDQARPTDNGGGPASEAARTATPDRDVMQVARTSPPRPPSGAAAAAPTARLAGAGTGRTAAGGMDRMDDGEGSPRGVQRPADAAEEAAGASDGTHERVPDANDIALYDVLYGDIDEDCLESWESDSEASVSDGRDPVYIKDGNGRWKRKMPRKNGRKDYSTLKPEFEPADPPEKEADETDMDVDVDKDDKSSQANQQGR